MTGSVRVLPLALLLLAGTVGTAGESADDGPLRCGTLVVKAGPPVAPPGIGGIHLTSRGVLRVLVVFASFYDDETPHPYWPPHQPPVGMSAFIDPDTLNRSSSPFSLSRYFREVSIGQFQVIGEAIWVESLQSKWTYAQSGSYGLANWNVIHDRVDPAVDFVRYDNWTNSGDFQNTNAPDGIVDMVIMVWKTTVFQILGEASLGYKPGFVVDGKRLEMGFPERYDAPVGSGVTVQYSYTDQPGRVMRTMAHELGHWLLGGPHPYNGSAPGGKRQFWGLLCAGERFSSCANAYERERLGWISVPELAPDSTAMLPDFLTTGSAFSIRPNGAGTDEVFYLENHQLSSDVDDVTQNRADRGLWVLHQAGPYTELDNLRILPSDGGWIWDGEQSTTACFGQGLPLFVRVSPYVPFGLSHRDQLPTTSSSVNWMYAHRPGRTGIECGTFAAGEGFTGAFTASSAPILSPFSNPSTHDWTGHATGVTVEVLSDSGGIVRVRRYADPLAAPPARRHLGADPSAPGSGPLVLAWGGEWAEGQPFEPDVTSSELQRRIGEGGMWQTVYAGSETHWSEISLEIVESGTIPVEYRARVEDASGKLSTWSPLYRTATSLTEVAADLVDPGPDFALEQNFPNPFNPSTVIRYRVGNPGHVELTITDLLGRIVATLVDEVIHAGSHTVRFNGRGLSSGQYICRLRSAEGTLTRRVLLLR